MSAHENRIGRPSREVVIIDLLPLIGATADKNRRLTFIEYQVWKD